MLRFVRGSSSTVAQVENCADYRLSPRRKRFYSWVRTDGKQLERTEKLMLSGLNYTRALIAGLNTISTDDIRRYDETPRGGRAGHPKGSTDDCADFSLDDDAFISSSDADDCSQDNRDIIVLVHGFAGGVAFWAQNWEFLAQRYRVYAVDLPGFARSERRRTKVRSLEESMLIMTGYMERWCRKLNFGKGVVLVGHSFGCFVCAHFAMRCPRFVKVLTMTEPWGMNQANPDRIKSVPVTLRLLLRIFYATNPLSVLRGLGPAGPYVMRRSRPDFGRNWSGYLSDVQLVYDYLYHCNARSPAVGETLFRVCCHCDIAAKVPLPEVLPNNLNRSIPVGILFGAESWIAPGEALQMAEIMRAKGYTVITDSVEHAGHQIFTDNVQIFNEKVCAMIDGLRGGADAYADGAAEPFVDTTAPAPLSCRSNKE